MIGFICVMSAGAYWRSQTVGNWFCFVTMTAFWTTGTLLVFYLLHVIEKFHVIPWMLVEMAVCGYDAFLKFSGWRAGQLAQGERTVQHDTTS